MDKFSLFQSLVLSVLFLGAGTWTQLKERHIAKLERAYLGMCRSMRLHLVTSGSPVRVYLVALPPPQLFGFFCYLELGRGLGPCAHGRLLAAVCSSIRALVWERVDNGSRFTSWTSAWDSWVLAIRKGGSFWKRLIKFARESAQRAGAIAAGWQRSRSSCAALLAHWSLHSGCVCGNLALPSRLCSLPESLWLQTGLGPRMPSRLMGSAGRSVASSRTLNALPAFNNMLAILGYAGTCATRRGASTTRCGHRLQAACDVLPGAGSREADHGLDSQAAVSQGLGPLPSSWSMPCDLQAPQLPCQQALDVRIGFGVLGTSWRLRGLPFASHATPYKPLLMNGAR